LIYFSTFEIIYEQMAIINQISERKKRKIYSTIDIW